MQIRENSLDMYLVIDSDIVYSTKRAGECILYCFFTLYTLSFPKIHVLYCFCLQNYFSTRFTQISCRSSVHTDVIVFIFPLIILYTSLFTVSRSGVSRYSRQRFCDLK